MKTTRTSHQVQVTVDLELEDAPLIEHARIRRFPTADPPAQYQAVGMTIVYRMVDSPTWTIHWTLHVARWFGDFHSHAVGKFFPQDFTTEPGMDNPLPAWVTELVDANLPPTMDV